MLNSGETSESVLPYKIRRGGLHIPGEVKIGQKEHIRRYIVLDQWFRPKAVGAFKLRGGIGSGESAVANSCQIRVIPPDGEKVKQDIVAILAKYLEFKGRPVRTDPDAFWNYSFAAQTALSYILLSYPGILEDLKKSNTDHRILEMIQEAQDMGPGGERLLD